MSLANEDVTVTDADRAKAAEVVEQSRYRGAAVLTKCVVAALADARAEAEDHLAVERLRAFRARAEAEVLTRRAETAEIALSTARRGWDTARAEADQLRDAMRALAEEWELRAEHLRGGGERAATLRAAARVRDLADGGRR